MLAWLDVHIELFFWFSECGYPLTLGDSIFQYLCYSSTNTGSWWQTTFLEYIEIESWKELAC